MNSMEWEEFYKKMGIKKQEKRTEEEIRDFLIKDMQKNLKAMRKEIFKVSAEDFARLIGVSKPTVFKYEKIGKDSTNMSYKEYLIVCSYIEYEFKKLFVERDKACIRICELAMPEIADTVKKIIGKKSILLSDYGFVLNYTPCKRYLDTFAYEKNIKADAIGKKYPYSPIVIMNDAYKNDAEDLKKMINIAKKIERFQKVKNNIFIDRKTIESICSNISSNMNKSEKIIIYNKCLKELSQGIDNEELKEVDLGEWFLAKDKINLDNGYIEISNIAEYDRPKIISRSYILLKIMSIFEEHGLYPNLFSWAYDLDKSRRPFYYNKGKLKISKPWDIRQMYCKDTKEMIEVKEDDEYLKERYIVAELDKGLSYIKKIFAIDDKEKTVILEQIKNIIYKEKDNGMSKSLWNLLSSKISEYIR